MIGYDELKNASDYADACLNKQPQEWAPAEGIDLEGLTKFAIEDSAKTILGTLAEGPPLDLESLTMGVMVGVRLANLVLNPPASSNPVV